VPRLSLRARLTLAATAALAAGLAAGAVLLVFVTHRAALSTVDSAALRAGQEVAGLEDAGQLPVRIPAGSAAAFIQVVDGAGHVLKASANADHLVPILRPGEIAAVRGGTPLDLPGDRVGVIGPVRAVGVPTRGDGDAETVIVAVETSQLADSERVVRRWVAFTAPALLALLAVLTWLLVGWTLRPVEALRRGAADLSGRELDQRLPVAPAGDEINRLAATLNDMLDRIDASRRRQRSFVSDAAHELRSPIAGIRTQVEVAVRTGEWEQTAAGVLADVERLSRLVNDLLLLARLDEARAGPGGPGDGTVDLAALVEDLAGRYGGARVPVRVERPAGPVVVHGDADGLRRLVTNLVDNAVRHAAAAVTVTVLAAPPADAQPPLPQAPASRAQGSRAQGSRAQGSRAQGSRAQGSRAQGSRARRCVRITVRDDGPGIPAADRQRMFDRFARRDDARDRDAGGSGLGLPIARELARAHGGTVSLEDAAPGLRAVVRLPARAGDLRRGGEGPIAGPDGGTYQ
jgi:signal transduction histidine kinase